jgi:hypothetical protein
MPKTQEQLDAWDRLVDEMFAADEDNPYASDIVEPDLDPPSLVDVPLPTPGRAGSYNAIKSKK